MSDTPGAEAGPAGPVVREVPEGDNRERLVCRDCGFIDYQNPRIVVGAVCRWDERVLLCRRAIEPGRGLWTLPAGYLEVEETAQDGARREVWEEARARIRIDALLAVYDIPAISQVQLIYRAELASEEFAAGEESLEVGLFGWDDIPHEQLAFPSVRWALAHARAVTGTSGFVPFGNPADDDARPAADAGARQGGG